MEHHSNDLPWRGRAELIRARTTSDGRLDEDDVDRLLEKHGERVALLVVSGASNVTGFIQPIHRLARKAHRFGARILVDAAQLAPHSRIDVRPDDDPEHIDFLALSAHKMYAPFGTGALVGPKEVFSQSAPEYMGGGTVEMVTTDDVLWADLPDRDEAGSPNVVGAIAMAVAAQELTETALEGVERHESSLTAYALDRLHSIPGLTIYGARDVGPGHERVGVISFNLSSVPHALVAAVLGYEGGIGVRSGCFCAQPYVTHLLGLSRDQQMRWRRELLSGDRSRRPGLVRVSFGAYNTFEEVDALIEMLQAIRRHKYHGNYYVDSVSGEYRPVGYQEHIADYFSLTDRTFSERFAVSPRLSYSPGAITFH
jgi:selenocysteine lyase/cysteine desulfurase